MKTIQTRFGEVSYDPNKIILFPNGLIGFEDLRQFIVLPNEKKNSLWCIQSVEQGHIAFLLTDPTKYYPDYWINPGREERQLLGIGNNDNYFVLTMITVHKDKQITLNLMAPVLYTPKTDKAIQIILEGSEYSSRTPLP